MKLLGETAGETARSALCVGVCLYVRSIYCNFLISSYLEWL